MMTIQSWHDVPVTTRADPLGQRYNVDFDKVLAVFVLPNNCTGVMLEELDRGWVGIWAIGGTGVPDYGRCTLSDGPIAVLSTPVESLLKLNAAA